MERIFNNVKITSSFDVPETGGNLVSGETIGKHFGKIAKHMNDESIHHTVDNVLSDTSTNPVQNKVINAALNNKADSLHTHTKLEITDFPTSLPASDVKAWAKADTKPTYTASEVGADASGSANTALTNAKSYTDTKIADLINGAPSTLDTLGEIANAMEENQSVVDALNIAIGIKANTSDLNSHINNKSNPHSVTKTQVGLGNVPNVTTNDQTPSYTEATSLTKLSSGEKLSVAFGKISKAITDLITHIADSVKHITSTERTNWNAAKTHADSAHAPSNAQANVIETVKVNGTALTPSSKAVDITVPTNNNQLTNGAGYITSSGTAKTISDTLPISKGGTGKTTGIDAANVLIGSLETGDTAPTDDTNIIIQGVGNYSDKFYRKPASLLWNYIKSKLATVATSGSYNDLSNKPTIPSVGNGTITIKQAGTTKGTFTTNQSGNTTIELADNNTWRDVVDNLTSTDATKSLSANQGKVLKGLVDGKAAASHTHSAYVNQNAFSNVVVGSTTVAADSATDTLTLVAGSNITITPDATNDKITIAAKDTTYSSMTGATSSAAGASGLVPAPASGKQSSYLRGDGTWAVPTNTDTKVTNTLNTTAKAYVTGTTSSSTNTGTQVFDTGVYLDTTPGMLTATTFKGALSGNASSSSKLVSSSYTTISIATSDWSTNSGGGYVCTKTLSSAMAYTNFNFDVVLSTDQAAAKLQIEAWNCIIADGRIAQTTSSGSTTAFTFYAFTNKPSVAINVGIQGVS